MNDFDSIAKLLLTDTYDQSISNQELSEYLIKKDITSTRTSPSTSNISVNKNPPNYSLPVDQTMHFVLFIYSLQDKVSVDMQRKIKDITHAFQNNMISISDYFKRIQLLFGKYLWNSTLASYNVYLYNMQMVRQHLYIQQQRMYKLQSLRTSQSIPPKHNPYSSTIHYTNDNSEVSDISTNKIVNIHELKDKMQNISQKNNIVVDNSEVYSLMEEALIHHMKKKIKDLIQIATKRRTGDSKSMNINRRISKSPMKRKSRNTRKYHKENICSDVNSPSFNLLYPAGESNSLDTTLHLVDENHRKQIIYKDVLELLGTMDLGR